MPKIKLLLLLLIPFFVSCVTPITVEPLDYVTQRKELQQKEVDSQQKKLQSTIKKLDGEIANLDDLKKTTIICQDAEKSLEKLADKKISIWLTVLAALLTGGTSFANAEFTLAWASMSAGVVAWRGVINTNEEETRKGLVKVRAQKAEIEYGISNKEVIKIYSICNQYTKIEEKEGSDDQKNSVKSLTGKKKVAMNKKISKL